MNAKQGQVTIKGVVYNVVSGRTLDQLMVEMPDLARVLAQQGVERVLGVQRPRGRALWSVHEYADGSFSSLQQV